MRPVKLAVVLYTVSAAILLILFALDPRGAHAQERDAFDVDIIPAASKHLGVVHEWGFERLDVRELVALTTEKRGQGRAAPACSGRDCPDRQAKKPTSGQSQM